MTQKKNCTKKIFAVIFLVTLVVSCTEIPWELAYRNKTPEAAKVAITSFKLAGVDAVIDDVLIKVTLPAGTDVTNLTPEVTHTGLEYAPQGAQDFSSPVFYKLLDADDEEYRYVVSVNFMGGGGESAESPITSFKLAGIEGIIEGGYINVAVPRRTDVTNIAPEITHKWQSYEPKGAQDFTKPIVYAVFGADNKTRAYIVNVIFPEADLSKKLGITANGISTTIEVTETFTALHNYIASNFTTSTATGDTLILLGDYIDLPSLQVAGDSGSTMPLEGYINATNTDVTGGTPSAPHGKLLRLLVVGINSFNGKNGNDIPHVVFHFENVPGVHSMNDDTTNDKNGYSASGMRTYLTDNFLPGLINAGVPTPFLWAPSRRVASTGGGTPFAETITDTLWLPTIYELTATNEESHSSETASNQADFTEFYTDAAWRRKYGSNTWYWMSSNATEANGERFVMTDGGGVSNYPGNWKMGCVPAFCVK